MKLVDRFLNHITHEKRYSVHTIRAYKDDIHSFVEFLNIRNEQMLLSVSSLDVRSWILHLANSNHAPRTYKRKLSSVKALFKFLMREQVLSKNPADSVIVPKHQNPLPDFFSSKETDNLFDCVEFSDSFEDVRSKLILHLFYATGMRLSELINLKISDVDYRLQQITVLGKRKKQRNIPVSQVLLQEIKYYLDKREQITENNLPFLFITNKGNQAYPKLIQRMVDKYFGQVTTSEKKHPHKLRHTFATHMLNNGADLNAVKELLGHASLAATEVYTHNTYEKLKSVYNQAHPRA